MRNAVQLVTYVDRLGGGGIAELAALLRGPLRSLFGGVHLLPFFFPIDGADAGFDPIDHTHVDPRLGSWADIRSLAADLDVMADLIVNHISSRAPQFLDFLRQGPESVHEGLFLTAEAVFPRGLTAAELNAIYRPRPGAHHYRLGQVFKPPAAGHGHRHPQYRLMPVESGQRDRRRRAPQPQQRSWANRDPQVELITADRPGRPAHQVHRRRRAPQHQWRS